MRTNAAALQIIKDSEAFESKPYICPAGVPTIGYGTTVYPNGEKVSLKDTPISKELAEKYLYVDISAKERAVSRLVKSSINDNQFSALVSFTYNLGEGNLQKSTLLKKVNLNPNDESIFEEFLKWNKSAGKVLNGLTIRRNKEAQLYFKK